MKKLILYCIIFYFFILCDHSYAQNGQSQFQSENTSKLFLNQELLFLKLSFSRKDVRKTTNDSTYIKIDISYMDSEALWNIFEAKLRKRGHYRLNNCYLPPIKIKINKSESKGTLFEGNKKLKLVLPCSINKSHNDYIIKEYMAYKLYEIISPYHIKSRLVEIDFTDTTGKKTKTSDLKGILLEDIKKVANRFDGKVINRSIHPLNLDPLVSVRNEFFQFMIGNTDFSMAALHNEKLLFVNKNMYPIPYDFDLSGLVDASYAFVPEVNEREQLPISSVTERLYRGFKRDSQIIQRVRNEFIENRTEIFKIVDNLSPYFENSSSFAIAKKYIEDFYNIIENNAKFENEIIYKLRTK